MKKQQFSSKNILQQYRNPDHTKSIQFNVDQIANQLTVTQAKFPSRVLTKDSSHNYRSASSLNTKTNHCSVINSTANNQSGRGNPFNPVQSVVSLIRQEEIRMQSVNGRTQACQLKRQLKKLQSEMKKRLSEHPLWSKFLKAGNSSKLSHLDIYIEYKRMEDQLKAESTSRRVLEQQNQNLKKQLQQQSEGQQEQYSRFTQEIRNCIQKIEQMNNIIRSRDQTIQKIQQEANNAKMLIKELKRKLAQRTQELQIEKSSNNMETLKLKQLHQGKLKQKDHQIQIMRSDIQRLNSKTLQLENIIKKKNSQIKLIENKCQQMHNSHEKQRQSIQNQRQTEIKQLMEQYEKVGTRREEEIIRTFEQKQQLLKTQKESLNLQLNQQINKSHQLIQSNQALSDQFQALKAITGQKQQKLLKLQSKVGTLMDQKQVSENEIKKLLYQVDQKNIQVTRLSKKAEQVNKRLIEQEQKNQLTIRANESEVIRLRQKIQSLQKSQFQNSQQFRKAAKINTQNYKAIGRLIEVLHRLRKIVNPNDPVSQNQQLQQSQEQLGTIINLITNLLDELNEKSLNYQKMALKMRDGFQKITSEFESLICTLTDNSNNQVIEILIKQLFKEVKHISIEDFIQQRRCAAKMSNISQFVKTVKNKKLLTKDHLSKTYKSQYAMIGGNEQQTIFKGQHIQKRALTQSQEQDSLCDFEKQQPSNSNYGRNSKKSKKNNSVNRFQSKREFIANINTEAIKKQQNYQVNKQFTKNLIKKRLERQPQASNLHANDMYGSKAYSSIHQIVENELNKQNSTTDLNSYNSTRNYHGLSQLNDPLKVNKKQGSLRKSTVKTPGLSKQSSKAAIYNKYFGR